MTQPSNKLSRFWQELKRRKVTRTITVYAAAAFVILELLSIIIEPLRLPEWTLQFAIVFLCIGFIIAVILSWIYDVHPEGGIVKTEPVHKVKPEDIHPSSNSWKIASYISFVVIVGLIVLNIIPRTNRSEDIATLEKSIAVLPFENMSSDEEYAYIGGAFTDEIIMELQKIRAFDRVLSRTSTMQYAENLPTIPEIAEKLNVNYIIEGSIQRHEENVSIRVQVIRARNEDHIWGKEYDRKWEDIFSIQDEIAYSVATELKIVLSPEEKELIDKKPTTSLTAYDYFQKGKELLWEFQVRQDIVALDRAERLFAEALKYDTSFALAYSGQAWIYFFKNRYDYLSENYLDSTLILADFALQNNPQLSDAHLIKGMYYNDMGLWNKAVKCFDKAIHYNSNDWQGYYHRGDIYFSNGLVRESIDNIIQAAYHASGPQLPNLLFWLGHAYCFLGYIEIANDYWDEALILVGESSIYYLVYGACENTQGNYEKATEYFEKALALDSSNVDYLWRIGGAYMRLGNYSEALNSCMKWLNKQSDISNPWINGMHRIGYILFQLGRFDEAEFYFDRQLELSLTHIELNYKYAQSRAAHYDLAGVYAFRGDKEKAYQYLTEFSTKESFPLWWVSLFRIDPLFDSLRDEPEFQQILQDVEAKYQAEHERVRQWLEENDML